ncbi:MAG: hypothetical protein ACREAA_19705 [Candidatus Polarisedimenticolia bacterium]
MSAILIWAAVFRLILLPSTPWLSDDIWRYMWEGRLQWHGVNPYAHAPDDPALEHLRDGIYEKVNHRHLPAIYPPVTQWAMALGASAGPSVLAMKGIFVLAEAGVVLALLALLRRRGLPASRVLLYAWNPLAVVEVAGSGHNDPLGIAFLLAATAAIIGERPVMSMASLALSGLSKLFPWCLFLLFARRARAALLLLPGLALVCYLPYLGAGSGLFRSTRAYAESWRSNDVLFGLLVAAVNVTGLSPRLTTWMSAHGLENLYGQPHMIARVAAALILAAWMALLVRRQATHRLPVEKGIFLFTAAMLLLLPTLHPWYLLWILPWLCLYPSAAWLALAGLVPLGYQVSAWTRWVEFVPFYALLAVTALSRRRRGKPVIEWSP